MVGCVSALSVPVYNGRDNLFALSVEGIDGDLIDDLSSVSRVTLTIGATTVDSDVVGSSVIWWTDSMLIRGESIDILSFRLGGVGLTAGTYTDCALVIYDPSHASGYRSTTSIKITVID